MKKKVTGVFFILLLSLSVGLNIFLYRDSMTTKEELGSTWELVAENSNDSINFLRSVDLNEAAETDEGKEYLERLYFNVLSQLKSNYPEANDVLSEAGMVLRKATEEGQVTREDIILYNRSLGVLDTTLYNFDRELRTDMDWYKAFTTKNNPNKFTQSIEEATE